jgi:hypothetical protein
MFIVRSGWNGLYLQLHGPRGWSLTDKADDATTFASAAEALAAARRCGVVDPIILRQVR